MSQVNVSIHRSVKATSDGGRSQSSPNQEGSLFRQLVEESPGGLERQREAEGRQSQAFGQKRKRNGRSALLSECTMIGGRIMRYFGKILLSVAVLAGLSWSAGFSQQKTPIATDTTSASRQSTCDGLNTVLRASAAPLAPGSVVLITADLPWCDIRIEIPGIIISADPALPQVETPTGTKPQGFARLHSVTLTSAAVFNPNTQQTTTSEAANTDLRNLWIDSNSRSFTVGSCTISVNSVDAVAINVNPSFSDSMCPGNPVRSVSNGAAASQSSTGAMVENGFIFAGRNGIVALRRSATGDGADGLTVQDMDIHVSDAQQFSGDGLNRAAIITAGANTVSIRRNLIVGDVSPPFPTETVGILVDDPLIAPSPSSSRDMTVESNNFQYLLAIGEFNNDRKGTFQRNEATNTKHGIFLRDTDNNVDTTNTDCANRTATDASADSALWVLGQNNFDLQTRNGFEVHGGCDHMFGNNKVNAPNFGISLRGSTKYSSIAGNSLNATLIGVVLGSTTCFNDVIGRSGDIFQDVSTDGADTQCLPATNTVTGKKINTLPAGATMAELDLKPDLS